MIRASLLFVLTYLLTPNYLHADQNHEASPCSSLLKHEVRWLNSKDSTSLCQEFNGKLLLIVNTASKCAYTDQYEGLEQLYSQFRKDGLVVVGFPSNDFGAQEPGTEKQIQDFCRLTYSVNFPMFAKTSVTQTNASPLYQELGQISGRYPAWNFHKYLIGRDGEFITDFPSHVSPDNPKLLSAITSHL